MKQWLGIVFGTAAFILLGALAGTCQPQGSSVAFGVSGSAELPSAEPLSSLDYGVVLSAESLRATLLPTTTTSGRKAGFDSPLTRTDFVALAERTRVRFPPGPLLSGSPARATDTTTDKEVSAVPTTLPAPVTREYLEGIVRGFFPGDEYEYAAAVVACESSWNPDAIWTGAKNKTPQTKSAAGLWQFQLRTYLWVAEDAGVDPDPAARLDPVQATQAARFLVDRAGGGWSHWECAS